MGRYFGTDGFRGEANVTLLPEHAFRIGRFLAEFLGKKPKKDRVRVVIGRDTRRSGSMLESAAAAGLACGGADVYLLSVATTPCVAWCVRDGEFDAGIMITASHNPFYDNGIKIINVKGEKLGESVIGPLEDYIDGISGGSERAERGEIGSVREYPEGAGRYLSFLRSTVSVSLEGKKIALDAANGSAYRAAAEVFRALGAETVVINDRPDGVNINTDCGSTHMEGLLGTVVRERCDAGFAFDGDADRCLAADENGGLIDGDGILYILGKHLKAKGALEKDTVVTTVMSNFGLYKAFDREGISYEKTAVGDKYVYECMQSDGYTLGGEQSGHVILSPLETTGDGIVTALKIAEAYVSSGKAMSKLTDGFKRYPQLLKNVRVKDKAAAERNAAVREAAERFEERLAGEGRVLLRASGTEPLIRVMAEALTDEQCRETVDGIISVMEKEGLVL